MGSENIADLGDNWIENEFQHIDFGDERVNARFLRTVHLLSGKASGSIHQSCGSWKDVKGAYRLFSNERLDVDEIMGSHRIETAARMSGRKLLFSIQDTSYLDFDSHQKTKGLGSISKAYKKHKKGLLLHSALMVTPEGLPLGISSHKCWSRKPRDEEKGKKMARKYRTPIQKKESFKWLQALQETVDLNSEGTQIVTIADRESDIFEFLSAAEKLNTSFVVRNRMDRTFFNEKGEKTRLWTEISTLPAVKTMTIKIPKNLNREEREATVEVRHTHGDIPIRINVVYGPKNKKHDIHEKVTVHVVNVKEVNPPKGVEAVNWTLLTNTPVIDAQTAVEKAVWYTLRWKIEEFFRILKSGCQIEATRLSSADRLMRIIAVKSIIAFKLMYLAKAAIAHPEEDCSKVLSKEEWQTLYCRANRTSIPLQRPPTIKQAIIWLGKLGGFMNRKGDKLPGPMTLWRGYEILKESITMLFILKPQTCG